MPSPSVFKDAMVFTDTVTFSKAPVMPASSVGSTQFTSSDKLTTAKQFHERQVTATVFHDTVAITAHTTTFAIVQSAGVINKIEAVVPGTIATGSDRTVTVNVLKSTGAAAFATVLSGTISIDTATVVRDTVTGTIDTAQDDVVAGDLLQIITAVSGSAGNQAKGLAVVLTIGDSSPTV